MPMSGLHHAAFISNDMKSQIEFFTQVVGMKLVGIFPMHGAEDAVHCFLEAGDNSFLSFVQLKDAAAEPVPGVSHANDVLSPVARGALQHIAFKCDTMADLLEMRDRIRSHGYAVFGPLSHGMNYSMYFAAPEGILLEYSTTDTCAPVKAEDWVDPAAAATLGMSVGDLKRYTSPPSFTGAGGGKVPQPSGDGMVYPTPIPKPMFNALGHLPDDELAKAMEFEAPESAMSAH